LWLAEPKVLAVADLHIGYAWAHRQTGQLMPITVPEDTGERLTELQREYQAEQIVLVGDIVHRALPIAPLEEELTRLLGSLPAGVKIRLVAGNHDRNIDRLLHAPSKLEVTTHFAAAGCVFIHGDAGSAEMANETIRDAERTNQWIVMGHEHPSVTLSDGAATWEKYPCFLICDQLIVLPAFSRWAAGNSREDYMSPLLACKSVELRVAVLGHRLVPIRRA